MFSGLIVGAAMIVYAIYLGTRAIDARLEKACELLRNIEGRLDDIRSGLDVNRK
jgi:hypothetical protein